MWNNFWQNGDATEWGMIYKMDMSLPDGRIAFNQRSCAKIIKDEQQSSIFSNYLDFDQDCNHFIEFMIGNSVYRMSSVSLYLILFIVGVSLGILNCYYRKFCCFRSQVVESASEQEEEQAQEE